MRHGDPRAVIGAMLVACGAHPHDAQPPVWPAAPAAIAIAITDAAAPTTADAGPSPCWPGSGPIELARGAGDAVAVPTSSQAYPLRFATIDIAERARRATALHARHPGFDFTVDEIGVVTSITTDRMPCEARDELARAGTWTSQTRSAIASFVTALAGELSDVPYLSEYAVHGERSPSGELRLSLRQTRDIPTVVASALPARELDDAALEHRWADARMQWYRLVEPSTPGPRAAAAVTRKLSVQVALVPRYVKRIERRSVITRGALWVEVRRVADLDVDLLAANLDQLAKHRSTKIDGSFEMSLTGMDSRDAITGDALPDPR